MGQAGGARDDPGDSCASCSDCHEVVGDHLKHFKNNHPPYKLSVLFVINLPQVVFALGGLTKAAVVAYKQGWF